VGRAMVFFFWEQRNFQVIWWQVASGLYGLVEGLGKAWLFKQVCVPSMFFWFYFYKRFWFMYNWSLTIIQSQDILRLCNNWTKGVFLALSFTKFPILTRNLHRKFYRFVSYCKFATIFWYSDPFISRKFRIQQTQFFFIV
jgi:hypothetical protein